MKKSKTVLLATSIFAVAVNMNGCGVYGPPEFDPSRNILQPEYGAPYYVEPMITVAPTELDWYKLTKSRYAVFRVVSVPTEHPNEEMTPENAVYGVELLSFYAGDGTDLSGVSGISLLWKHRYLFSEGDVIFAELGEGIQEGETLRYEVKYDAFGPVYARFTDEKLELTDRFKLHDCYAYLYDFNGYTEWNYAVNQTGVMNETSGEPVYFVDGMMVEDAALFFAAIKKAQEAYETK